LLVDRAGALPSTNNNLTIKIKGVGFNPGNDRLSALKITYIDEDGEQPEVLVIDSEEESEEEEATEMVATNHHNHHR
jgi:hypothetical protein